MKSWRTTVFALSFMLLGGLLSPRPASSEPGGLHLNITPFGGYATWAEEVNLDDKAEFGGRLGIGFGRYTTLAELEDAAEKMNRAAQIWAP